MDSTIAASASVNPYSRYDLVDHTDSGRRQRIGTVGERDLRVQIGGGCCVVEEGAKGIGHALVRFR